MISNVIQSYITSLKRFTNKEQNELNMHYNLEPRVFTQLIQKLNDEEKEVLRLMQILYKMDKLTDEENIEAKIIFNKQSGNSNNLLKKLELMIKIKQQIIGKKIRKFNINKRYARGMSEARLKSKSTIIYAQLLDDNTVQLSGYIDAILKYPKTLYENENVIEGYIGYDDENQGSVKYGNWFISGDFKTLKWEHASDKNWGYDTSFSELKD